MKKFTINCSANGQSTEVPLYIGEPKQENHPIQHQAEWLTKERGITVPKEVMDSLQKIKELSDKNGVSFEELCSYALQASLTSSEMTKPAELQKSTDKINI